jgi:hypothetical protein
MTDLNRVKHLAGILNEEMDKGDMHDALGDAMIAMDQANQSVRAVSDELEKDFYKDESVEEVDDHQTLRKLAGLQEEAPNMIKVRVINSGYKTDRGMMDAEIISQELDQRMMPILKVRIKDVNMGDPVVAEFKDGGWVVDMD